MLAGTVRTASRQTWIELEEIVRDTVAALLAPLAIEHTLQYRRGVPPVVNEEVSTRILTHAIEAVGPDVLADTRQSGGGEDFSWYLEEIPGAMARLGRVVGRGPQLDLHQPTFDLDERALAIGLRVMVNIVEQAAALLTPRASVRVCTPTRRAKWHSAHARHGELSRNPWCPDDSRHAFRAQPAARRPRRCGHVCPGADIT